MTVSTRRMPMFIAVAIVVAACGGGQDEASETDCPTTTPGQQPTATTAVDPRCVERATETSPGTTDDELDGQTWKGTVHGTFQFPNCSAGTVSGDVTIAVGEGGSLSGNVDTTVSPTTCGGVQVGEQRVSVIVVGGSKSEQALHIQFNDGSVADLAINGNQATGALTQPGPNAEFVYLGNANGRTDVRLEETG